MIAVKNCDHANIKLLKAYDMDKCKQFLSQKNKFIIEPSSKNTNNTTNSSILRSLFKVAYTIPVTTNLNERRTTKHHSELVKSNSAICQLFLFWRQTQTRYFDDHINSGFRCVLFQDSEVNECSKCIRKNSFGSFKSVWQT